MVKEDFMLPQTQEVERITTEILIYKQQAATSIIEIGHRLIQAKELIPHGEWGKWLEEKVDFSQNTAGQFMRVAKEFSNSESVKNLGTRKLFLLLEVPPDERETFIQQPQQLPSGETKTVQEMSTRELQIAIKAQKEAELKAQEAEQKVKFTKEQMVNLISEVQRLNIKVAEIPEPKIIEVEVIPPEIQEKVANAEFLKKTVERLSQQNSDMKLQLSSAKTSTDNTMDLASKVDRFTWRINQFLGEMGSLAYVGGQYMRSTEYSRLAYDKALSNMEKWIHEVRESMQGSHYNIKNEGDVIDIE